MEKLIVIEGKEKYQYKDLKSFNEDDTFTLFLREKGKDKPYFAGRIDNITKFQ